MHVGMSTIFQHTHRHTSDREGYRHDVAPAELAEPLGLESVWTVEQMSLRVQARQITGVIDGAA